ncbi:MAG TPA: winged helix DNA-binding domain-containing protein [Chloroflexia bacterium]|nr:winged helix DNA-binding domain-containing protein [Chloroflexia bacterium]
MAMQRIMSRLSWPQVCARRLERQGLAAPFESSGVADVAGAMCGAHAQIMIAAELSIGLRMSGVTRRDVQQALWVEHSLVKTRGPRGTVHLLPSRDLPMWTGALSALPVRRNAGGKDELLTAGQTEEVVAAIGDALQDSDLTVDELTEAVVQRAGAWAGEPAMPAFQALWPRWRAAEGVAANRGVLCFGPNRGRNVTYTSPNRWLPGFRPQASEAALSALVGRYLYSYGPATPEQFARWMSVPARWAIDLFDSLAAELQQVEVEGTPAWVAQGDTKGTLHPPNGVRLLPYFDAYVVGCHPRDLLFPGRASARALSGGQAGNLPVLLVGGVVAGLWHHRRSGKVLDITVEPFGQPSPAQRREIEHEAERTGKILEGTTRLAFGKVEVGPHA